MASDADAYERGVKISQTSLTPNFREGVQANPWFQLGYQMGLKHGASAAGMMSRAKSEFPAVAARLQASRPGAPDTFAVEDRFYFGKGRKERFASHSTPRQSTTSGPSGTWKKIELSVGGKKAWHTELIRGSVLVGWVDQHPNTRQWHAFDGKTDQQIGVGSESEMKRLVESL